MILITRPDKPLAYAPKGTTTRKPSLEIVSSGIETLYVFYRLLVNELLSVTLRCKELVYGSLSSNQVKPPVSWDVSSLKEWLIGQLSQMFHGKSFSISVNLFEQGCDRYEYALMVAYNAEKLAQLGSHSPEFLHL